MNETFKRVSFDGEGDVTPKLYERNYSTASGNSGALIMACASTGRASGENFRSAKS